MEAADPRGGTVLREMLNRESSEGHCCGFYGLFSYFQKKHLPNQIRQQSAARSGNP